ncbi:MAG TPA: hypothetical protein VEX12_14620 [Microbacterium sp.]|nr:hypothetical protein [Microbacterium sp.]
MDVLDRVRDIGGEIELTEAQVAQARRKVLDGLRADASRPTRRRLWIGIGGIGGVLAAATAATAIVIAVTTPQAAVVEAVTPTPSAPPVVVTPPPVTTPPTEIVGAAVVLEHAAELAPLSSPALQPGQYLLVQSRIEYVVTYDADIVDGAPYSSPRSEAEAGWLVTSSYDTYIPEDRHGEWVRVFNPDTSVIAWYGPEAEALADQWEGEVQRTEPIVQRVQGGLIEPFESGYTIGSPEYYAAMPRDPQALLDWYWDYNGLEDEEYATEILAQAIILDLELNAAPADLRASMFRVLSLLEGVAVQSVEGNVTTLSIDIDLAGAQRLTLSLDNETGLVVGSSATRAPGSPIIPDSVPDSRVLTTTTVVDSAP